MAVQGFISAFIGTLEWRQSVAGRSWFHPFLRVMSTSAKECPTCSRVTHRDGVSFDPRYAFGQLRTFRVLCTPGSCDQAFCLGVGSSGGI